MTIFGGLRADFLSYQTLLTVLFLQKKSIMQALAANMSRGGGHFHINLYGTAVFQGIIFQHKFLDGENEN